MKIKLIVGILAVLVGLGAIYWVLQSEQALLTHPKGIIAQSELNLLATNYFLMFIVAVPTYILLFVVIWKYRAKRTKKVSQEKPHKSFNQVVLWTIPSIIVTIMSVITWYATHKLDPYKPLESEVPPLTIQVVALDWKWLFIYPEQKIASLNFVQFPERTPIHFELAGDDSPMNSFWIPELSGQIYAMSGMITSLHMMADGPGSYAGRAAEINGSGLADMTFVAKSCSSTDFEEWVATVSQSSQQLTHSTYQQLATRGINTSVVLYSYVEPNLFDQIVMKYHSP